jgi:hypothetical protein
MQKTYFFQVLTLLVRRLYILDVELSEMSFLMIDESESLENYSLAAIDSGDNDITLLIDTDEFLS